MILHNGCNLTIGKIGEILFKPGFYYYVGSAMGSGGFKRVKRHFDVASGVNETRKWHIDYLLPHADAVGALLMQTEDAIECEVAKALAGFSENILGFGCSDCTCKTHLFFSDKDLLKDLKKTLRNITGNESIIIYPHM